MIIFQFTMKCSDFLVRRQSLAKVYSVMKILVDGILASVLQKDNN